MSRRDMRAKLLLVMEKLGHTSVEDFAEFVHRESDDDHKIRKDTVINWFDQDNVEIRSKLAGFFSHFCERRGIRFGAQNFNTPVDEFKKKLDQMSHTPTTTSSPQTTDSDFLIGQYQIIRPYVAGSTTYILEAMEIERHDGRLRHLLVSHNRREQHFLYKGYAEVEPRYYFALLSRPHEDIPNAFARRCISFYTAPPRYTPCLSGVMLRGVNGGHGKFAAALPFIALRLSSTTTLHSMQQVPVTNADAGAEPLHKTHPDSNLLIGEVRERWFKPVFDICHAIYSDEKFTRGTNNAFRDPERPVVGDLVLKTVVPDVLKDIHVLNSKSWLKGVEALEAISRADAEQPQN